MWWVFDGAGGVDGGGEGFRVGGGDSNGKRGGGRGGRVD